MNNLHKFLNGFMIAIIMFSMMLILFFLGMVLPMIFSILFGPIVGIVTLLLAVGVIGGLGSMIFDKL